MDETDVERMHEREGKKKEKKESSERLCACRKRESM